MTQEVFLLVWRKLGQFQGRSAIGTWLYRLTVNTCLMELRRRRAKMRGGGVEHTGPDDQTQDVHSFIDVFDIWQAIDLLPSGYRKVLMLAMEGHGHAEIGSQLGITPGTSKSQLFKARAQLAETLNNGRRHSGELNVMGNGHSNKDRRGVQTCAAQRCRARFLKRHIRHEFCSERCRKRMRRRTCGNGQRD
jgi:RNA polymerase sigma-70 factor (ECF subfamily)